MDNTTSIDSTKQPAAPRAEHRGGAGRHLMPTDDAAQVCRTWMSLGVCARRPAKVRRARVSECPPTRPDAIPGLRRATSVLRRRCVLHSCEKEAWARRC